MCISFFSSRTPFLFANLIEDCRPIATKSRRHSSEDREFIEIKTKRLLQEGIIEPSNSPWRAQALVVNNGGKKRMVIDYSQTINRFTLLDAYPLPKIYELVNKIAQYPEVYSTIDLRSAYHQVPVSSSDKLYTAFEAGGKLYEFCRMLFGVTNVVACFQRKMDDLIARSEFEDTFAYLDNVTTCGMTQEEHDENLAKFCEAAQDCYLTLNDEKSVFSTRSLNLLGYRIGERKLSPIPERLQLLLELPVPHDLKSLRRVNGVFSYYASHLSDKIRPLNKVQSFPLPQDAVDAFERLKQDLVGACLVPIDESTPSAVETVASDFALSATLNQGGRQIAFYSGTLQGSELHQAPIEKEAQAAVEAINKWRHFLLRRHFTLITDQRLASFMYSIKNFGKIKNTSLAHGLSKLQL